MSWPGFYALGGAWLFLLLIPLIIFYFLKLKRPRMEIPSLALWRQVINDRRVNSPFQKFKRNLLLLLQMLLLIFLVLAAMQPFVHSGADRAEHLPVLIDCSASMAALDGPGGKSRLDVAKERVEELIDNLLPDQRMSLIAVSSTARRITDFTTNKRILRDALDKIETTPVSSELEDALRMTQALARTVSIDTVVFFTDGNVPKDVDFELPFELNYQRLPAGGTNIGITAFNARRTKENDWDVFVRVEGSTVGESSATAILSQDGVVLTEEPVSVDAGQSQRLVFSVQTKAKSSLEVQLRPNGFDSLAYDNRAYLDLPAARRLKVYCPLDLESYRHALDVHQTVTVYPAKDDSITAANYDVLVSDQADDQTIDATVRLFVGVIPDDLKKTVSVEISLADVVDWQRSAALLQHVQFSDVQISDLPKSAKGVTDGDYEQLGYEILAFGQSGPLVLQKRIGKKLSFFLMFHTDRSTLPYRIGFPILVSNLVQIGLHEAELSEVRSNRTGVLPPLTLKADTEYRVSPPDGGDRSLKSDEEGILSGVPAPQVGRYTVREGSKEVASLGTSLLSAEETSLVAVEEIQFRELSVSAAEADIKSDRPLWPMLASIAFFFLLAEWWYFQHRPGGMA